MTENDWQDLLQDPVGRTGPSPERSSGGQFAPPASSGQAGTFIQSVSQAWPVKGPGCGGCGSPVPQHPQAPMKTQASATKGMAIDQLFAYVKAIPRDLDQHAEYLKQLASESETVTAFVKRKEWDVFLAAGRPRKLVVYQTEPSDLHDDLHAAYALEKVQVAQSYTQYVPPRADSLQETIEPTDLLVIDTIMHAEQLIRELERHAPQVHHRILIRGTGAFGEQAEGVHGPGLLPAIRYFIRQHPEWTTVNHRKEQYGMTLLSKDPRDLKPMPSNWQQLLNAAKASWKAGQIVVGQYGPLRDSPAQEQRLSLCLLCPSLNAGRCAECGCPVDNKTSYPQEECPLGKWSSIEETS